jgi:hypothetical protein
MERNGDSQKDKTGHFLYVKINQESGIEQQTYNYRH